MVFVLCIQFFQSLLLIYYLIFQISDYLLEFVNMYSFVIGDPVAVFIAAILTAAHIRDVFWHWLAVSVAYLFDCLLVNMF